MSVEYAKAGVDYGKIQPFKEMMQEVGKQTLSFPNRRGVYIYPETDDILEYRGPHKPLWLQIIEGLGNKIWIAEWMYQNTGNPRYFAGIGIDTAMMAAVDVIRRGALPIAYSDEVAAGDSDWFRDKARSKVLADSYYRACKICGMALVGGESPSLRYLVKAELPVKSAPVLSGSAVGIIAPPDRLITGQKLEPGDHIIGATSSGLHANGISLVIEKAMMLPEKFFTKLPNGNTLGEEALIPTRSYVRLMEALLGSCVDIHAVVPGTGSGVSKIASDKRPFTYRIKRWVEVSPLFQFMKKKFSLTLNDCLETFNWGIGFYLFVPEGEVRRTIEIGMATGYEIQDLGILERGERKVIFEPEGIVLLPPGE
jgi:phosphoribosylformylglycinamidine cyclo-ligase